MSQSYRYWTGNLYTGSTVFIQHQDGHLSKGEVVNVAEQRFIVAGISSPFDKFTATSIEGVVALPDEYDVRERYSIQRQRDYLTHLDISALSSHQIKHLYAGLHLAKLLVESELSLYGGDFKLIKFNSTLNLGLLLGLKFILLFF
nr:hypothetical protein [Providencia rettgeri]